MIHMMYLAAGMAILLDEEVIAGGEGELQIRLAPPYIEILGANLPEVLLESDIVAHLIATEPVLYYYAVSPDPDDFRQAVSSYLGEVSLSRDALLQAYGALRYMLSGEWTGGSATS